jgi:uncharacterized protein
MLDIDEMTTDEIYELLRKVGHGHMGCSLEGHPYVVPMQYYFEAPDIYIFTTVGMKTHYMDANPEVCLQVEEVNNLEHWRSVTVMGRVERVTERSEIDRIMEIVKAQNPARSPAVNRTWTDAWGRANKTAIYHIYPTEMNGRTTEGTSSPK